MSAFGGLMITNRGRALQAKALLGAELRFTRMALGDGELGTSSIIDLTVLKHEVKSLNLTSLRVLNDGKAKVGAILSNQDLASGFYFREWGLFAQDPDLGEILYCYGNAGVNAEYIPAGGGPDIVEKHLDIIAIVGNAANITATIDESLVFVSMQDFSTHQTATVLDHPDNSVTDDKIGNRTADPTQAPATNGPGKLVQWISWFANRIKAITGAANWYDAPPTTLTAAKNHIDATNNPHATTAAQVGAVAKTGDTMTGPLTLSGDPTQNLHAATKQYVDAIKQGLDVKDSVRVATTTNITLSGVQTIDGVALAVGNRILVKDQTTASQNGIYVVASGAWTRATDADTSTKVTPGMYVFVEEGTVNADSGWVLTTNGAITLGTTALVFTQFSGAGQIVAGNALTKSGNQLDVAVDNVGIEVYSDALRLKDSGVTDAKIGNRTVSDATTPAGDTGTLTTLLGYLANRIKAITGKTNWQDAPDITLATLATHKSRHATGGSDALTPADIGAATASDLATHLANKANPHAVTAVQVGALIAGTANTDVNKVKAIMLKTDTRSTVLTYTSGNLTKVEEKDGSTVVKTTNLTYDGNGNLTQVQEIAGGSTVTTTLTYTSGTLTSMSRSVS